MPAAAADSSIILIGPPGSGKSACGRELASILNWSFLDTDCEIERRSGRSVPDIFRLEGEESFRNQETALLHFLVSGTRTRLVLATGGGMPVRPENYRLLETLGTIVCLYADCATLVERTAEGGSGRPLLSGGAKARLSELLVCRDHIYRRPEHRLDTGSLTPRQAAEQIVNLLGLSR